MVMQLGQNDARPTSYWFVGIRATRLRDFVIAMENREFAWNELLGLVEESHTLGPDLASKNLDTIVHQYERVMRLLGLTEKVDGRYGRTRRGTELARMAQAGATELASDERDLLVKQVFLGSSRTDSPVTRLLGRFIAEKPPWNEEQFRATACALYVELVGRDQLYLRRHEESEWRLINDKEQITEFWGCRPFVIELGLIDEIQMQKRGIHRTARPYLLLPLRQHLAQPLPPTTARQLITRYLAESFADAERVSIPLLMLEVCKGEGISAGDFKNALAVLYESYPKDFYFDRVPAVLISGRDRGYVKIGGAWRSYILPSKEVSEDDRRHPGA